MPRESKIKSGSASKYGNKTKPQVVQRDADGLYNCVRCGQAFTRQRGIFPASQSPLYRGNGGYLDVCTRCMDELFGHYSFVLGNDKEAMHRLCLKFDIYWSESIYAMIEGKERSVGTPFRNYISKANLYNYINKTYDDTLDEQREELETRKREMEEFEAQKEQLAERYAEKMQELDVKDAELDEKLAYVNQNVELIQRHQQQEAQREADEAEAKEREQREQRERFLNTPVEDEDVQAPTKEMIRFWGTGFTPDLYCKLQRRYETWTANKGELDQTQEALYRNVCILEETINRNMMAGKPIEASTKALNETLGALNEKPVQKDQKDAGDVAFDSHPFGVGIKMCENTRPIPEPDPMFQDVDGVVKYITTWFLGHLCKMLGIRNSYCKLYEQEMERLRIERPEFESEDTETLFNDIFTDDISPGGDSS